MSVLESLCYNMAKLECLDLRVNLILIHPEDLKEVGSRLDVFDSLSPELQSFRPEWSGRCVGNLFGVRTIETSLVERGNPDVVPEAGLTIHILDVLEMAKGDLYRKPVQRDPELRFKRLICKGKRFLAKILKVDSPPSIPG
jgi:hypothetical protein